MAVPCLVDDALPAPPPTTAIRPAEPLPAVPTTRPEPRRSAFSTPAALADGLPHRRAILVVLAAAAFMAQLDLFIVNVAFPAIGQSFTQASLADLSWVLNAYAIVFAAVLVPAGRLADQFGRRRFFLAGVATFGLASAWCSVAPDLATLVAGRVVQAVGAALIVPTSLGLLFPAFPRRQHTLVLGIWAGVAAVAASSGAPLGGLLVRVDWRWIFLVNVPLALVALVAGIAVLPEIRAERGARLPDTLSVIAVFLAITLLTLVIVQGPQWGWSSDAGVLSALAALVAAGVAVWRSRHPRAVIEVSLFRNQQFTGATLALLVYFVGFAAFLLVTVLFLQDLWHFDALQTGLAIAPGPLVAAVFAINSGPISARFGLRAAAVAGPLFVAMAALFWLGVARDQPNYVFGFLPGMLVGGVGAGLTQAPLLAAATVLPDARATTGSAVLNMARQVGSAVGVALTVMLLATAPTGSLDGFRDCWWLMVGVMLVAALISVRAAPGRSPKAVVWEPTDISA